MRLPRASGASTPSTAPGTPGRQPSRRRTREERPASASQEATRSPHAAIRSSDARDIHDNQSHLEEGVAPAAVHDRRDVLDVVVAASSQRSASEPERASHGELPPRPRSLSEGSDLQRSGSPPPQPAVRRFQVDGLVAQAALRLASPAPLLSQRSSSGDAPLSGRRTPSTSRSAAAPASPAAAAIATAASGYGRALASAAVASSLRLAAARPPTGLPASEDGHGAVASRVALPGSVAVGGPRSMLARTAFDMIRASSSSAVAARGGLPGSAALGANAQGDRAAPTR